MENNESDENPRIWTVPSTYNMDLKSRLRHDTNTFCLFVKAQTSVVYVYPGEHLISSHAFSFIFSPTWIIQQAVPLTHEILHNFSGPG